MAIKTPIKKVMPLLNRGAFCLNTIEQTFLDYLPANKMSETANPDEADVFFLFLFANPDPPDVHITIPDSLKPNAPELNFTTLEKTVKTLNGILEKPRIFYMDCFGSKRPNPHQNTIPDYIKETDILVCPASLPDHPNAFTVGHYDERRFFVSGRYEREPNSALIMVDQVEVFGPMLFPLLDKIDKLFITGRDDFNSITGYQALKPYRDKIEMAMLTWPDGVRGFLNRAERVINLQWNLGPEFIGVEGAFCGTRPIYPDNAYYRDIFGDTPVTFYETENPESLCNAVLKSSPLTPDEINTFTKRFSCTLHVTSFWNLSIKYYQESIMPKKIMSLVDPTLYCTSPVYHPFMDYLPEGKLSETKDPSDADAFLSFVHGAINPPNASICTQINFYTLDKFHKLLTAIKNPDILRIFFMDCIGLSRQVQHECILPSFIQDTDIIASPILMPPHPNSYLLRPIDAKRFYTSPYNFFKSERKMNSAIISADNLGNLQNSINLLLPIMPHLDLLVVAGMSEPLEDHSPASALFPFTEKIMLQHFSWPHGVRNILNSVQYSICLEPNFGPCVIGFEGSLCGVTPIYPDTPFYREIFGDLPALYYTPNDSESLIAQLNTNKVWSDEDIDASITHFSAETQLSSFWNSVHDIMEGSNA